ncbi:MAG: serine hydrolase domain-containing protein [Candidatus Promineifilaceae bacterium]|nr:serine hydrolase domain-containing protein [Candidatus Promineifilaceae bacterium]
MKRQLILVVQIFMVLLLVTALISVAGCQSASEVTEDSSAAVPASASTEVPSTEVPPTDVPPTEVPEPPEAAPEMITTADEMVGIWLGKVAGETGYVMYTDDGRYTVALVKDDLGSAPRVAGEYWFEDDMIHLRDLENAGHWTECDEEMVGVYEVLVGEDGRVQFQSVEDGCDEGGFTRQYIFANMIQERVGEAVPIAETDGGSAELEAALQTIVDQYVADGAPSAVLMIDAPDLNFSWKGAAGMADPDAGVEMMADDQFIISSVTKMFTAVTLLKLAEQDLLTLDDPIGQYLPEEVVSRIAVLDGESFGEEITVRQLLNHTSGLGDFSNGEDVDENGLPDFKDLVLGEPDRIWTTDSVIEWAIENAPPVSAPGEAYHYSDTNFQLLGQIIESVSGMSLAEAYRETIFTPLGMDHTYFEFNEEVVPGVDGRAVSHGFYLGNDWNQLDSHSYEWGSGGLVSTVEDQNKFLRAWANGELFADPNTMAEMLTWVQAPDDGVYYGLGTIRFVFDEWGIPGLGEVQGHGGLFNSQAFYWPEQNVTIVGTLNSNEPQFGFIGMMIEALSAVAEYVSAVEA